jgi:hypothetical protein
MKRTDRPLVRRNGASDYLATKYGIIRAVPTLAKLAVVGGGPKFHKCGRRPLYDPDDLDDWAGELLGQALASTSDHDAACGSTLPVSRSASGTGSGPVMALCAGRRSTERSPLEIKAARASGGAAGR